MPLQDGGITRRAPWSTRSSRFATPDEPVVQRLQTPRWRQSMGLSLKPEHDVTPFPFEDVERIVSSDQNASRPSPTSTLRPPTRTRVISSPRASIEI